MLCGLVSSIRKYISPFACWCVICAALGCSSNDGDLSSVAGPEEESESADVMSLQLGEVRPGTTHDLQFHFANRNTFPVRILRVETGCACAQPTFSNAWVQPGDDVVCDVKYHAASKSGNDRRALYVRLEPPAGVAPRLEVASMIRAPLVIDVPSVQFGSVSAGRSRTRKFLLLSYVEHDLEEEVSVKADRDNVTCRIEMLSTDDLGLRLPAKLLGLSPKFAWLVSATMISRQDVKVEPLTGLIQCSGFGETVAVPYRCSVRPPVVAVPSTVGASLGASTTTGQFRLHFLDKEFTTMPADSFKVQVVEEQGDVQCRATVVPTEKGLVVKWNVSSGTSRLSRGKFVFSAIDEPALCEVPYTFMLPVE